jgi:glycosyltransferase involved in cell wall biosynthesis
MNAAIVLSRHGSFAGIRKKMGGDTSFMLELAAVRKYAESFEHVFVFSHDSESFEAEMPKNCSHVKFRSAFLYTLFGWLVILFFVWRHHIRVIRVETVSGMLSVAFVNKLTGAKVVLDYLYLWHLAAGKGIKAGFIRRLESFLLNFADCFIAANAAVKGFIGGRGKMIDVAANGLLIPVFAKAKPDGNLLKMRGKKVIFVGRLTAVKDPLTLVRAFGKVERKFPSAHLIICGDGELRQECEKEAGKNVHFMGFAGNVPSLLKASDIFVLPSAYDASPRALVEAMGTGLACIATKVGGIPDYLDESCGILVAPGDANVLAEKIGYLLSHAKVARKLGEKAKRKVTEKYDYEKNVEKEISFMKKEAGLK